ncbi:MAG: hypothetical protein H6719_09405 [Sandaracinaceae bacterium]|nr:hypothetical protein [Sandaracinaceae bacterium]
MTRHGLARLGLLSVLLSGLLAGCGSSHGRDDDAGPGADAGAMADGGATGRDGGSRRDAGSIDAGAAADAGTPAPCDPEDARAEVCPDALCDGPSSWHWNGDDCFEIDCGACRGSDCDVAAFSREACLAAHATCTPAICRESGGTWRFWGEDCGPFVCGVAPPEDCLVGAPVCDCGPLGTFDPVLGCQNDVICTMGPPPRDPEVACNETGGTWGDFCCHSECGERCFDACVSPACDCGVGRVFEDQRGCVESSRCYEGRRDGEICDDGARCGFGLICCESCGGAGCFGPARCRAPLCDDDPDIDMCGNNLLAP